MADIKVNGLTYSGIDRIQLPKSNGAGSVNFWEADSILTMISGTQVDYYENPYITSAHRGGLAFIRAKVAYLPNLASVRGESAFSNCTTDALIIPELQATEPLMGYATDIELIDTGAHLTSLAKYAFSNQTTVILRCSTVMTLENAGSTFKSGATVYVPSALLAEFQSAEGWSTLVSDGTITLAAIEGSAYESPEWFKEG